MKFELKGLKELEKNLKQLEKNANEIHGHNEVPLNKLFNSTFMKRYTKFSNITSFFDASPFTIDTQEDLATLPEDELDKYVSENTSFKSWQEMLTTASSEWVAKKLGF